MNNYVSAIMMLFFYPDFRKKTLAFPFLFSYDDHNPPHFHAEYNGNRILVDIIKGRVIKGAFPSRQLKFVLAWTEIHRDELMQNWELAKDDRPLMKVAPLM